MRSSLRQYIFHVLSVAIVLTAVICAPRAARAGAASTKTLILPHVEVSGSLNTGISLLNSGHGAVDVTLVPYGGDGTLLSGGVKITLEPGTSYLASLSKALSAGASLSWVRIEATGPVTGFAMIGSDDRITSVPLVEGVSTTLTLPYLISRDDIYTSIHLLNAGTSPADLLIKSFSSAGVELGSVRSSRPLGPGAKLNGTVRSILGSGKASTGASYLIISSDQPLAGVALVGAPGRLFSVPME